MSIFRDRMGASGSAILAALQVSTLPETLVVLGSGFKGFEERLGAPRSVDLAKVVHMPIPKVEGHGASLVIGAVQKRPVAVLTGRVHLYEGYSAEEVVYPLRV